LEPRHPLADGQYLARWRIQAAPDQQAIEAAAIQYPAPRRSAVEMDEMRAGIPADAASPHGERRLLHPAEIAVEGNVDRPADDMLAMLGHPESGGREHLVG